MKTKRLHGLMACCTLLWLLARHQALAAENFIQTYINAQGGCWSGHALSFVLVGSERQSPFGKPGADWTSEDLVSLRRVLAGCIEASAARQNPYILDETKRDVDRLLATIPQIVSSARAERDAQARQLAARRELAQGRLERATQEREQAQASAAVEVAKLEHEAALAEEAARAAVTAANRKLEEATQMSGDAKAKIAESLATLRPASSPTTKPSNAGSRGELEELDDDLTATVSSTFVACKATGQLIEAAKWIAVKDMNTVGQLVKSGDCFVLDQGARVRVRIADAKATQGAVCVGIKGHAECLWIPSSILHSSN